MPNSANVTNIRDNRNTALLFLNANNTVGGYYTDHNGARFKMRGVKSGNLATADILHPDTEAVLGSLTLRGRRNQAAVIVADGELHLGDQDIPVCAAKAHMEDGSIGLSVFRDQMPERVDFLFGEPPQQEAPPMVDENGVPF